MYSFYIWIDADSCPLPVKNYVIDMAKAKKMNVNFVANHEISIPKNDPHFAMHVCEKISGAADDYIFNKAGQNDLVITRDIPFAQRLVEKKIFVMNDRGTVFTKENIKERLAERNFNLNLALIGLTESTKSRYGQKELKKFADTFERHTSQLIVNETFSMNRSEKQN